MRVLVCGGRDFSDIALVVAALDALHRKRSIDIIITGGALGADRLGERWAEANGIMWVQYPAQWEVYGKSAGPRRNEQMLREGKPDGVVAFPGGAGTAHMVRIAKAAGVKVWEVSPGRSAWGPGLAQKPPYSSS